MIHPKWMELIAHWKISFSKLYNYYQMYNWGKAGRANHPVNGVSWHDAVSYCKWKGLSLPTEQEWTFAATSRGKVNKEFPWGNGKPSCEYAVYDTKEIGPGRYHIEEAT